MGFTDFDPETAEDITTNSSSSSSSSGGAGGSGSSQRDGYTKRNDKYVPVGYDEDRYPFYCLKHPEYALVENEDGYEWLSWPATPEVRYEIEHPDESWEQVSDDNLKLVYWGDLEFKRVCSTVSEELGGDLVDMLRDSPEMALEAVDLADRLNKGNSPAFDAVSCECCGGEYHERIGDYHLLDGEVLCGCHTIEELDDRNLI